MGFFQVGGGAELDVQVSGPGLGQQPLAGLVAATEAALKARPKPVKPPDDEDLTLQPALIAKGRALFASAGCANCHQMKIEGKLVEPALNAPALAKLSATGGCLDAAVSVPHFALSPAQKAALVAAIKTPPGSEAAPTAVIARTMLAFNCYACHIRD